MSATRELSCQEVVELVTDYVEGTMRAELRAAFDAHLVECEGCASYVEQVEATIRLAGTIEAGALSPELEAGLLAAFRAFARPDETGS